MTQASALKKEKRLQKLSYVFLGFFLLAALGCTNEPPKIGVVNVVRVVNESIEGQKANAEVNALVKAKQADLKKKEVTLEEVKKKAAELREVVLQHIRKAIDTIGQEEKFLLILPNENIVYFQKPTDITDKVIKKYNELQRGK